MSDRSADKGRFFALAIVPIVAMEPVMAHFIPAALRTLPVWHRYAEAVLLAIAAALAVTVVVGGVAAWRREKGRHHG